MAVAIVNVRIARPTAPGGAGSLLFNIAGTSRCDLLVERLVPDGSRTIVLNQPNRPGTATDIAVDPLPVGGYEVTTYDYVTLEVVVVPVVVPAYVAPVPGCTDDGADNYDPAATADNGSCTYTPRLVLAAPVPALVANGRPVHVTLHSPAIPGATPAPADAFINLENLSGAVGAVLTVNGYRFTSGPVLLATNFVDAPSLAEALNAVQPLAAAYAIRLNQDNEVRLTARATGTPSNLVITTSTPALITVANLPGVNEVRSQGRARWGCYLEVWTGAPQANPSTFSDLYEDAYRDEYGVLLGGGGVQAAPVLAQRFELNYRADNAYTFDIAPALRQFTGHAYPRASGDCPDRLCSYFLRFGELYATPASIRRQRNAYQSGTGWALDAVEIPAPFAPNAYLLSARPGPWRGYSGGAAPTVLLGNEPGPGFYPTRLTRTRFDGVTDTVAGPVVGQGRVTRLVLPPDFLANRLACGVALDVGAGYVDLPALDLLPYDGPALTFANGQGGFDTVVFEGVREEITKRSTATYATPTGSATRSAQAPEAFRLHSGLLTRAEWAWLRRELGNSPDVWLETDEGPQPVLVTAYATEADEVLGLYTVAVDCEPLLQPVYGLTN